jgi:hypothetical protein
LRLEGEPVGADAAVARAAKANGTATAKPRARTTRAKARV